MDRELRLATSTGKVIFGSDKTLKAVKIGKAKLAILSSNCADDLREDVDRYAALQVIEHRRDHAERAAAGAFLRARPEGPRPLRSRCWSDGNRG